MLIFAADFTTSPLSSLCLSGFDLPLPYALISLSPSRHYFLCLPLLCRRFSPCLHAARIIFFAFFHTPLSPLRVAIIACPPSVFSLISHSRVDACFADLLIARYWQLLLMDFASPCF